MLHLPMLSAYSEMAVIDRPEYARKRGERIYSVMNFRGQLRANNSPVPQWRE